MPQDYHTWTYPDIPDDVASQILEQNLVVVGVLGRSRCKTANKMQAFGMGPGRNHAPREGQIQMYYKPGSGALMLHFETSWDEIILGQLLEAVQDSSSFDFDTFYEQARSGFVRQMLLALHICHILVYVETGQTFDVTLVTIFQLMKLLREQQVMQFAAQFLRDFPAGVWLGEKVRVCTPRILFLFENYPSEVDKTRECISSYEFQTEDTVYELLRQHNIVTNSSSSSLLALPNNKQFVFYNSHEQLHPDRLLKAIDALKMAMHKPDVKEEEEDKEILELAPFEGFVKPYGEFLIGKEEQAREEEQLYRKEHTAWHFLQRHVQDAQQGSFDEGSFKQVQNHGQLHLMPIRDWLECMKVMHKMLVLNAQDDHYETANEDYRLFLRNFDLSLNYERKFWSHLCELGLKKGISSYKHSAPAIYGKSKHQQLLGEAIEAFQEEGRGPYAQAALVKLEAICLKFWQDGRQQCSVLSLRSLPCTQSKDMPHEKHSSGVMHISSCNCGRTQGRREDPFTLRQANYEFYELMAQMCNLCVKIKQYQFPIFEPSISDYRAAAFEAAFPLLKVGKKEEEDEEEVVLPPQQQQEVEEEEQQLSQPLSPTFGSDLNMSIAGFGASLQESQASSEQLTGSSSDTSEAGSENELILQLKENKVEIVEEISANSTTEYLPGLVHQFSSPGLLPLFPSWSLACVGPSSIYSHNTGLQEHFQSGFLSGANFLLPWDVNVRLVQAPPQQQQQQKLHLGKKQQQRFRKQGDRLVLKIFVGFEYECSRGHRFMMCSPERVLRGGADIERETCHKVVHQNMPLYYPCPCRSQSNYLAQLMRIHVVTPKAPVNIILDPKVCVGSQQTKYTFTLGSITPPRLSQSAYWILRLPYVYQGDDHLLPPPDKLEADDMLAGGYLLAGMFGVAETDADDQSRAAFTRI